ncbi:MAG: hypothetical protein ACYC2T_00010 [Bacillota bacterium]
MSFFPYASFRIETNLGVDKIAEKLNEIIEPVQIIREPATKHKPFQGHIKNNKFKISRIINWRSTFLPVIKGEFDENVIKFSMLLKSTTIVSLLSVYVLSFLMLWVTVVSKNIFAAIFVAGIILAIYILSLVLFNSEVTKSKVIIDGAFKESKSKRPKYKR